MTTPRVIETAITHGHDHAEIKARASLLLEALGDDEYAELLNIAAEL
jgi:hypothetical protein